MNIQYFAEDVELPVLDEKRLNEWIENVAMRHDRHVGAITYVFCSDEKILEVNRQFLQHDYYTDIITFDYTQGKRIGADIYISLDTVRTNAEQYADNYEEELHRTIIHGVLHLCGIGDKKPGEREIMEAHENDALSLLL